MLTDDENDELDDIEAEILALRYWIKENPTYIDGCVEKTRKIRQLQDLRFTILEGDDEL